MKTNKNIKHVILDLDQTITIDQGSWLQFTQLLGANPDIHTDIFNKYKDGKLNYSEAKKELISLWKTVSTLEKETLKSTFKNIKLRKGALKAISYLRSKYKLCIISGAIDLLVESMAQKLNIKDHYASTKFIFDENRTLTDFHYTLSRGEEKLTFFNDYCQKYNVKTAECSAIGDGESDMPIFEMVELPILFIASETTEAQKLKIPTHLSDWKDINEIL